MKKNSTSQRSAPAPRNLGQDGLLNLRVLIGLLVCLAGIFIALLGFGARSAQAQQNQRIISQSTDPLVPAMFDCSKIHELGIDKQENMRAGAIMIYCGEAQGGSASPGAYEARKHRPLSRHRGRRRAQHFRAGRALNRRKRGRDAPAR